MDEMMLLRMSLEDLSGFVRTGNASRDQGLPAGYSFRMYTPGMEEDWIRIQDEADDYIKADKNLFKEEFGRHRGELPRRMLFLAHHETLVGTATAWLDNIYGETGTGRLHWVAIVPEYQGKGLAAPLVSRVMSIFPDLGCSRAFLLTNAVRITAISLYLKLGFNPVFRNPEEQEAWEEILGIIKSLRM